MNLSPLTPAYRAFQRASSIIILAFFVAQSEASYAIGGPLIVTGLATLAATAILVYEVAYYRRFEYELTPESLDIRSGVIGRRERELPYGRIQNVDISRNAIQRVLGIAAVSFETAGGRETEGSIRYVSAGEAARLQQEIQRRTQGEKAGVAAQQDEAEELYAITSNELGLVGALSFDARVLGVLSLVGPGSVPFFSETLTPSTLIATTLGGLVAISLLLGAWVLGIVVAVVNYYGFRLSRSGDEIRYERGLFRRYNGSIPVDKIQTVTIEDNPLKRLFGYATLRVETAGYAPGRNGQRGSQVAVPIASRERVQTLASEIEPVSIPTFEQPPRRIRRRYVVRYLLAIGFLLAIGYAVDWFVAIDLPWYAIGGLIVGVVPAAHLKWRHRGFWLGTDHVVTRNGFWNRSITIVPYYRIQTVIDLRTIFQRRWNVATIAVDTAGSGSLLGLDAAAIDIEVTDAVRLREQLPDRLQDALADRRRSFRPSVLEPGFWTS